MGAFFATKARACEHEMRTVKASRRRVRATVDGHGTGSIWIVDVPSVSPVDRRSHCQYPGPGLRKLNLD